MFLVYANLRPNYRAVIQKVPMDARARAFVPRPGAAAKTGTQVYMDLDAVGRANANVQQLLASASAAQCPRP